MTAPHASAGAIVRQLFHHAWPILVAQLLSMAMMIADTLIAGRYGTLDLAGVAIARRAAERHGGRLLLANHPQGGFIATLELPLAG